METLKNGVHAAISNYVTTKVAALPNLTDEQRERVLEIAIAAASKHIGREPSYEGIANLVRSQAIRPVPNTFDANCEKI